jgi:hypothetical protein
LRQEEICWFNRAGLAYGQENQIMELAALTCPACGGLIDWDEQDNLFRCLYCGTLLQMESAPDQNSKPEIAEKNRTNQNLVEKLLSLHETQGEIRDLWHGRKSWKLEKRFRNLGREEAALIKDISMLRDSLGLESGSRTVHIKPVYVKSEIDDGRGILSALGMFFFGGILVVPFIMVDQIISVLFKSIGSFGLFSILGWLVYLCACVLSFFYFRRTEHTLFSLAHDITGWVQGILQPRI